MTIKVNVKTVGLAGAAIAGLMYAGYKYILAKTVGNICDIAAKKLDKVSDEFVEEAIADAAKDAVDDAIQTASKATINQVKNEMLTTVRSSVNTEWNRMKAEVKRQLLAQAGTIDISELKKEAVTAACDKMREDVNDAVLDAVGGLKRSYENKLNSRLYDGRYEYDSADPVKSAIDALAASALRQTTDYYKESYAQKIVDLVEEKDEGYSYAINALHKISDGVSGVYYKTSIDDMIVDLVKEV